MAEVMFSGSSRYANDFKTLIDRSVAIASLPLSMMRNAGDRLNAEQKALESLDNRLDGLRSALAGVRSATGSASLHGSVSNGSAMTVTTSTGAAAGAYTIAVDSLGAAENVMSAPGSPAITDPAKGTLGSTNSFDLIYNGTPYRIAGTSLTAIAADINRVAGKDLQAGVVNLGTAGYALTVRSRHLRDDSISLFDASDTSRAANLLPDVVTDGASVQWRVNGSATPSTGDSRTVTLAPGVSVNLLAETGDGEWAAVTVDRRTNSLDEALTDLASAWNAVVTELDSHRGSNAGALAGNSVLSAASDLLRSVARSSGGGAPGLDLAALGVAIDDKGRMTFRSSDLAGAVSRHGIDGIMDWFGGDGGFAAAAEAAVSRVAGDGTLPGLLGELVSSASRTAAAQESRIESEEERIDQLRVVLEHQFSAADALIASLEQQAGYVTNLFDSMRAAAEN